jgi:hypothetical protein
MGGASAERNRRSVVEHALDRQRVVLILSPHKDIDARHECLPFTPLVAGSGLSCTPASARIGVPGTRCHS